MAYELTAMMGVALRLGVSLDLPSSLVAIEDGKLDVHEDEVGPFRLRFGYTLAAVSGFGYLIARSGEEVAQDAA
jgi:hypothetical protein